jgi:hypothetical protein
MVDAVFRSPCRHIGRRAVWLCVAVLAGCASFVPQQGPERDAGGSYLMLTQPVVAVGDTQEHEATGFPLHDNDSAVDAYVEVAQRPPEQPLFGRRILEWALESHPDDPFIHLGDLLDLSCRSEAQRMRRAFYSARSPGAVLPGNHDGLMFGIYSYPVLDRILDPDAQRWNRACRRGATSESAEFKSDREAFTKRDFIAGYLSALAQGRYRHDGLKAPREGGDETVSWRNPDPAAFVTAIEAQLFDGWRYADSFIAQRLKLPRAPGATRDVIVVALDTNQAGPLASAWDTLMGRSPGSIGNLHFDQIRAVTKWVSEAAVRGDIVVFAGHHNWNSLGVPSRALLGSLMSSVAHPLVYLSAHTHRGFWASHRTLDRRPLLEMNVSSLSDWPIAYRRIQFAYDETANRLKVHAELMPRGRRPHSSDADLIAAWEAQTCARANALPGHLELVDSALVQVQRESRGTLLQWLLAGLGPVCESCEQPLYEHAQAYQNMMLQALIQLEADLEPRVHGVQAARRPHWCGDDDFLTCAGRLMAERPADFRGHVDLFQRKAQLVEVVANHLDELEAPEAKAYMACRAVLAAKSDFDATPDDYNANRGEAKRRAEHFFVTEASVGID